MKFSPSHGSQEASENANWSSRNFQPVNSNSIILKLHRQSKQHERTHNSSKRELETQIRRTSYKVKISRFRKNIRLSSLQQKQNQNEEMQAAQPNTQGQELEMQQKPNSFQSFLRKTRIENSELKQRMKIFCNSITDRSKANIEKEISREIMKIQQRKTIYTVGSRSKKSSTREPQPDHLEGEKLNKVKKFTICHMILEKLMGLMMHDPKYIKIKNQNEALYKKLKEEMLHIMINDEAITQSLNFLTKEMSQERTEHHLFSWANLKEIQMKRKPFYFLREQKEDELAKQILSTFEMLRELIMQSLKDLDKPDQGYQLQQLWEHREVNVPLLKPKKFTKSQNCVRATTIQRLNPQDENSDPVRV